MSGQRRKDIHPAIQEWMDKHGCQNLMEVSRQTGIDRQTLEKLAAPDYQAKVLTKHMEYAKRFGLSLDVWAKKITQ
jgi:hypothetical protein